MATPSIELRDTPLHVDAEHKVTRFFLKSLDLNSNNADIVAGAYVNLMTRYYWTDRNTCEIDIGWEIWHNENNGTNYYHLQTGEFTASNKIYLQVLNENSEDTQSALYSCIANTHLDDIIEGDNPAGHWILYHYDEENFGELRNINDSRYNPQCKLKISNLEETEKITIGFGYQFNGEGLTEYILATGNNAPDAGSYHNGTYYYLDNGNYINIPENPYIAVEDNSEVTSTNYVNYYINDGENNYIAPTEYDPNETYYKFDNIIFDANTDYYIVKPVDPSSLFLVNFKVLSNNTTSLNKYINILKPSRYDNNVIFNKAGLDEFVKNIKNYPIINIEEITDVNIWNTYTEGKPCLKVIYGDNLKEFEYPIYTEVVEEHPIENKQYFIVDPESTDDTYIEAPTFTATYQVIDTEVSADTYNDGLHYIDRDIENYNVVVTTAEDYNDELHYILNNDEYILIPTNTELEYDENTEYYTKTITSELYLIPTDTDLVFDNAKRYYIYLPDFSSDVTYYDTTTSPEPTYGYEYVPVGSNIKFLEVDGTLKEPLDTTDADDISTWHTGTFRVKVNTDTFEVPIMGLAGGSGAIELSGNTIIDGDLFPAQDNTYDIGSASKRWKDLYLAGKLISSNTADGITGTSDNGTTLPSGTITGNTGAAINTTGGIYAAQNIYGLRVFNAVFNDYAECRTTINLAPGHVVIDNDDGSLSCSNARLQPGAQVISDTYGHLMGTTETATTPIAVAGRVLVYTYQPRENYHAGMAVCSAPDGTVDIMTREEIRDYPDCIVGIVSEIPQYDVWGSDNVKVDGRIWIKVK